MTTPRRIFLMSVATTCIGLSYPAAAQAPKPVDEKDPQAVSLGYVAEAKRADAKKYPKFEASQNCANCTLYQSKAGEAAGGCPLFAGRQVASKGWCSAWNKKAG
jgi:hypothetical protein